MNQAEADLGASNWPVYWYFIAVLVLSAPFWILGLVTTWQPLPRLPISSIMIVVPGVVAYAFVRRIDGRDRAISWLKRAWTLPRRKRSHWLIIALSMPPAILSVAYLGMQVAGKELPELVISPASIITLFALFIIPAALEELGWSCFALADLQQRMSALRASLLIGAVWSAWHIIPLLQAGRAMDWIAWWCLATVALRVLTTWIFNSTSRTIIPAALFHASENVSWQSFPVGGSHYEPSIHAISLWIVCAMVIGWCGGKTLSKRS